ncbi:MAG: GAF domain-containing protein, partial [Candidatus Eremiobacteraeota bacterium]|nr:GAF domain-containing protein [Candidatus Eremiobacteraeota bacterium]
MRTLKASRRLRAFAYWAVTTAIVIAFALAETWAEKYVSDRSRLAGTAVEITIIVVATLAFRPLHRLVENLVEASFTKRRREAREAMAKLTKELTSFNDATQLLRRIAETVDHHMEAVGSAVYLRRDKYVAEASTFDVPAEDVGADDPLVIRLRSTAAAADPRAFNSPAIGEIAFPMMAGGHLIGFLSLTPKRDEYEPEDRHVLATLAEATGLALVGLDPGLRPQAADRNNLPRMVTSFLGREAETSEIVALVVERDLVTLVGSGGVGKTRTALQVATNLADTFHDGVWFVEFAPLTSGDHIPSTIAKAMGLTLGRSGEHVATLTHALKAKHALLVFDNCEHIVEAAASVVAEILRSCPKIKILASSRQELDIPGEQAYRLPSLGEPTAVALFADRAGAGNRKFELTDENAAEVADICRRLDGIPLAIELAASRIAVLSLHQLAERLDERFRLLTQSSNDRLPRQQTLRAMIDWSFDLLDADERVVFRRLSTFSGGWTLKAAESVCTGGGIDERSVLELLSSLVSKSLVVVEEAGDDRRYDMLNSIKEYSNERLVAAGEADETAAKHSVHYADFARSLAPLVASLEDVRWLQALGPEIDNIRTALDWAIFLGNDAEAGLGLLAQIEWPELVTTPLEAVGWFDAAAKDVGDAGDAATKAGVLRSHARLEWLVGRPTAQRERTATAALDAARKSTDPSEIARALAALGSCYRDAGRFADAEPLFVEAYGTPDELSAIALNEVL